MNNIIVSNPQNYVFDFGEYFDSILINVKEMLRISLAVELGLTVVDESTIQTLNKNYRQNDSVTDVIAIRGMAYEMATQIAFWPIGDIFICYKRIQEQAETFNHSFKREFLYLFTHGLVHLFGYDHKTAVDAKRMNDIVEAAMTKIGVSRAS